MFNAIIDDFSTNCAPNFIQNTDILITLGNTSAENKGLECTIAYNRTSKVGFSKPCFLSKPPGFPQGCNQGKLNHL